MQDQSTSSADVSTDPRRVADENLQHAVREWLFAHKRIPANRDVIAVDTTLVYQARYLTSTGKVGRRSGCAVPDGDALVSSLGELMRYHGQRLWDWHRDVKGRRRGDTERLGCLPGCRVDHRSQRECRAYVTSLFGDCHEGRLDVSAHERVEDDGGVSLWLQFEHHRNGSARIVVREDPGAVRRFAMRLLDEVEKFDFREQVTR